MHKNKKAALDSKKGNFSVTHPLTESIDLFCGLSFDSIVAGLIQKIGDFRIGFKVSVDCTPLHAIQILFDLYQLKRESKSTVFHLMFVFHLFIIFILNYFCFRAGYKTYTLTLPILYPHLGILGSFLFPFMGYFLCREFIVSPLSCFHSWL